MSARRDSIINATAEVLDRAEGFRWPQRILDEYAEGSSERQQMRTARESMQRRARTSAELVLVLLSQGREDDAERALEQMRADWRSWAEWVEDFGVMVSRSFSVRLAQNVERAGDDLPSFGDMGMGLALVGALVLLVMVRR